MFLPHFSPEPTAKDCKLHKIVASQGAINIDNLVKFAHLFSGLGWFKCFGVSGAVQGVYRRREFFSSANCCFIGQNKLLHLEISLSVAETLSPVLSSEQIRWRGVSTPRHLLLKPKQRNVEPTLSSTTTQTDCIFAGGSPSREPREGWRRIPGRIWVLSLPHKNQNAVTTLLLRKNCDWAGLGDVTKWFFPGAEGGGALQ